MIVRLVAVTKAGKKHPLVLLAPEWNNTFVTGQHINPKDESTFGNLTREEMLGGNLSEEKKRKFPYIINPLESLQFFNGQKFDTDDPKDSAMLGFLKTAGKHKVAHSKKDFNRQVHAYYIENKEDEAKAEVDSFSLTFHAGELVRNSSADELYDVAMYLNYAIPGTGIDVKAYSMTRVQAEIFKLCQSSPAKVIAAYAPERKEDVYILSLVRHSILQHKEHGFYDGVLYIGNSIEAVREFMKRKENLPTIDRWGRELLIKTGKISDKKDPREEAKRHLDHAKICMVDQKFEEAFQAISLAERTCVDHEEIPVLKRRLQEAVEGTKVPAKQNDDPKGNDGQDQAFIAEITSLDMDGLVNLAYSRKLGLKKDLKEMSKEAITELILKNVK